MCVGVKCVFWGYHLACHNKQQQHFFLFPIFSISCFFIENGFVANKSHYKNLFCLNFDNYAQLLNTYQKKTNKFQTNK